MNSAIKNIKQIQNPKGFTLIELLITVAISSIVLLLVTQVFISTNKLNTIQEKVASLQQDIRAAMDIMSTDIMMTGFDPNGSANAGFTDNGADDNDTDSNSIALNYDYNGDGTIDENPVNGCYDVNRCYFYDYDSAKDLHRLMIRNIKTAGTDNVQPLTQDDIIITVNFSYTLADGSIDTDPSTNGNLTDIRLVTVQICGKITGAYAADHSNTYCFSRNIKPRNM